MRRTFLLSAASLLALTAAPAFAQATGDADQPAADATDSIEEITVTAQRREESLQDVPVSVGIVDDNTLAAINSGGADVRSLAGRVPSLNIESSFGRTFPRFYIRGLGNTDFDLNASQPVSLLYDDVVLENPILKGFPVFDLDRVEVLRGPQGTLFGRNTPAGIVKFDTVKPGRGKSFAKVSWGSYNTVNAEGAVEVPMGEGSAFRLSGLVQHRDDWVDNVATTKKNDLEGYDDLAVRAQFKWAASDVFNIRLSGQARDYKGSARLFRANLFNTGSNKLQGLTSGADFERDKVYNDGLNFQRLRAYNGAINLDYDLGPVTLYSITSYWNGNLKSRGDIDGGFGNQFAPVMGPGFIPFSAQSRDDVPSLDQFTQELRFASNAKGPGLGYQGGVFIFNEKLDIRSEDYSNPTDRNAAAVALQRQVSDAFGLFGSLSYNFGNGLTLQGGARWNHDKRDFKASRPYDVRPGFLGFGGPVPELTKKVKDSVLTWDASAVYEVSRAANVYARVARGYRAPSIQGRLLFGRDLSVADSEKTMSYEAGVKTTLLDRRLRLNVGVYAFDTKDLQLTAVGGASNFTTLLNADKARGRGVEVELEARPVTGLSLTGGLSYNHTKIDDAGLFVAGCAAPCTVLDPQRPGSPGIYSIDGNALPQAPKWTLNWTAGYEFPVGDGAVYAFTDWYYRSKIQFFLYKSVEFSDDKLLEGGLRLGWRNARYDIAAFARNITNDKSAVGGIDFNNLTGFVNEPRIFGVEGGIKF
ncbi:TonB-dependent receptor [Sphingomonas astaxanthinifaciens]|uniref:TonB-dependent receptor n=1 Tax=Sphingomonas astaxanthinifaciens DSM 22298 TaxID=1123267 RepID=A0ABQ5Z5X6_9SPHN|nr:TonB-dependent receptor [Sphingomonas astaxanthinifaciens]GLR48160.1 TonB-dependent receptor [Sphingomonas astaxanthinifaciens DSM 22298]